MLFPKVILIGLITLSVALQATILSIQVKQTTLRSKPSFLGKSIAKLSYAQKVQEQKLQNGWHYVKTVDSGVNGWIHSSALSTEDIVLNVTDKVSSTNVSQSEVLMAGKGFNKKTEDKSTNNSPSFKQIEDEYKKKNESINFSRVDNIEKSQPISNKSLSSFANDGKLKI